MNNLKHIVFYFLLFIFISVANTQTSSNFALRKQANLAYKNGDVITALELLNQAIFNDSTDALAFFNLANVYLSIPHRERAIKNFNRSIKLNSSNIELILDQFIFYSGLSTKLENLSQNFLPEFSEIDSSSDSTLIILLLRYMNRDSLEKSLREYLKSNSNIPMFVDYFLWLKSPIAFKLSKNYSISEDSSIIKDQISVKRLKLLNTLDDVLGTTKSAYIKVLDLENVLLDYSNSDNIEFGSIPSEIDTALLGTLKNNTIRQFVARFQHLDDHEVQELIDFYNSDLGIWVARMQNKSIEYVLNRANYNVFKNLKNKKNDT
jgi:tetratricopeptide (TPR) repeat protein